MSAPNSSGMGSYLQAYRYDSLDRLTSGPAGSYTHGESTHPHAVTGLSTIPNQYAAYDAMGNMTCRNPDTTSGHTCACSSPTGAVISYDNEGRLSSWTAPSGTSASEQEVAQSLEIGGACMSRRIVYRRQLLRAVEVFLEGTSSSRERAQRIVERCERMLRTQSKTFTLDQIVWSGFFQALTDSVYSESLEYLRDVRKMLLGYAPQRIERVGFRQDFRTLFTVDEMEWYTQLVNCTEFLAAIPFAQIHDATFPAWEKSQS